MNVQVILCDSVSGQRMALNAGVLARATSWSTRLQDKGAKTNNMYNLGATLFSYPLFCQYFKVLKGTHILLAPDQNHVHCIKYTPNIILSVEIDNNSNAKIKGLACYTLALINGCPVDNNATIVSTSNAKGNIQ